MSHELRTPLNAIIGYAEIIEEESDEAPQTKRDANSIVAAARHLTTLLNDIIDQSRIDSGGIKINAEVLPVAGMTAEVQGLMRPAANAAKVKFNASSDPTANFVVADHVRLRQCLLNLIGNAIKFSPNGDVTMRATLDRSGPAEMVVFAVSDTGIGIAKQELEQIFRPFGQANPGIGKTFGGTGLGLSISRDLARAMGGDISVESELGKGSTFYLRVPAATAQLLKAA
jgi:signal transduction histidine kinase